MRNNNNVRENEIITVVRWVICRSVPTIRPTVRCADTAIQLKYYCRLLRTKPGSNRNGSEKQKKTVTNIVIVVIMLQTSGGGGGSTGHRRGNSDVCEKHDPCQHGGICISTDNGPKCQCRDKNFEGARCEIGKWTIAGVNPTVSSFGTYLDNYCFTTFDYERIAVGRGRARVKSVSRRSNFQ